MEIPLPNELATYHLIVQRLNSMIETTQLDCLYHFLFTCGLQGNEKDKFKFVIKLAMWTLKHWCLLILCFSIPTSIVSSQLSKQFSN